MYEKVDEYFDAYITLLILSDKKKIPLKVSNGRRIQLLRDTNDMSVDRIFVNILLNTYSDIKKINFHIKPSLNKEVLDLITLRNDMKYINETNYNYVGIEFNFTTYDEFVDIMNSTLMKADIQW